MKIAYVLLAGSALLAAATADDLMNAAKKGNAAQVKDMLDENPTLVTARTPGGVSAILLAIYAGHPEIVDIFESHGANLSMAEACAAGRTARVEQYLKQGPAAANQLSPDGYPVLGLSIFFGHPEVAKMLIAAGADVNSPGTNVQKAAPLHSAVAARDRAIVELLISRGAHVNATQAGGFTPLHEAAATGQKEIAELLIRAGADRSRKTNDGQTPADLAAARGQREMADWLRSR